MLSGTGSSVTSDCHAADFHKTHTSVKILLKELPTQFHENPTKDSVTAAR
jgi:hypothetical protein